MQLVFRPQMCGNHHMSRMFPSALLFDQVPSELPHETASLTIIGCSEREMVHWSATKQFSVSEQDKDSVYHTFECVLLGTQPKYDSSRERMALRTVARVLDEEKSDSASFGFFFEHRRTFQDLVSHAEDMDKFEIEAFREIGDDLTELLSERGHIIPKDLISEVMPKLLINGHSVLYYQLVKNVHLGDALYLAGSKPQHTCEFLSNFFPMFEGNRLVFKALKDFSVSNSLQLAINYVSPSISLNVRRELLQKKFCFTCGCTRCIRETARGPSPFNELVELLFSRRITPTAMSIVQPILKQLAELPDRNFEKNRVYTKVLIEDRPWSIEQTYMLGSAAIEGCRNVATRLLILYVFCRDLACLGANQPSHRYYDDFRRYHELALTTFSDIYGKDHRLVKNVAEIANPQYVDPHWVKRGTYKEPLGDTESISDEPESVPEESASGVQ